MHSERIGSLAVLVCVLIAVAASIGNFAFAEDEERPIPPITPLSSDPMIMGEESVEVVGLDGPEADVKQVLDPQVTALILVGTDLTEEDQIDATSGTCLAIPEEPEA